MKVWRVGTLCDTRALEAARCAHELAAQVQTGRKHTLHEGRLTAAAWAQCQVKNVDHRTTGSVVLV